MAKMIYTQIMSAKETKANLYDLGRCIHEKILLTM